MFFKNSISSDSKVICDLFADFFQSIYRDSSSSSAPNTNMIDADVANTFCNGIGIPFISCQDISNALAEANDSYGDDGLPASILKCLSLSIAKPLSLIFNRSLSTGVFPDKWRISHIIPIFKNGKKSDISNYRGISILSAIPKIFEKIVTDYLYFNVKNLISIEQHGFYKKRSTITNLTEFAMFGINIVEKRSQLDVIYTDFCKAFDSINHNILLRKLANFGLNEMFLNWIKSYLCNRKQYVLLNGVRSKIISIDSGVPQGSHLGPLLFIIFINDIVKVLKHSNCLLYADDMKIFKKIDSLHDAEALQLDINAITDWCYANDLQMNIKKCHVMSYFRIKTPLNFNYQMKSENLKRVSNIKDLGILFDSSFNFNLHIDAMIARSNMLLGFVFRSTKNFTNTHTINTLYSSLVRSVLEYGVVVWNARHQTNSARIESVQKKFVRYYFRKIKWPYDRTEPYWVNLRNLPPYNTRCKIVGIDKLSSRREMICAQFIGDLISDRIDSHNLLMNLNLNIPAYPTRGFQPVYLNMHRTNYGKNSPLLLASFFFNEKYDAFDFNISKSLYKKNLKLLI